MSKPLRVLHENGCYLLEKFSRHFKNPSDFKLTLIARNPADAEQDIVITNDSHDGLADLVRRRLQGASS